MEFSALGMLKCALLLCIYTHTSNNDLSKEVSDIYCKVLQQYLQKMRFHKQEFDQRCSKNKDTGFRKEQKSWELFGASCQVNHGNIFSLLLQEYKKNHIRPDVCNWGQYRWKVSDFGNDSGDLLRSCLAIHDLQTASTVASVVSSKLIKSIIIRAVIKKRHVQFFSSCRRKDSCKQLQLVAHTAHFCANQRVSPSFIC